jgi:hypothetical protein
LLLLVLGGRGIVFVNTFYNGLRLAKVGGEFEFCPVACDKNVDVGIVSLKKLEFCPTDVLFGILDDADYT